MVKPGLGDFVCLAFSMSAGTGSAVGVTMHTHVPHLCTHHFTPCANTRLHTLCTRRPHAHAHTPLHTSCTLLLRSQASLSDFSVSHLPSPFVSGPGPLAAVQEPLHVLCWAVSPSAEGVAGLTAMVPPFGEVLSLHVPSRPCPV